MPRGPAQRTSPCLLNSQSEKVSLKVSLCSSIPDAKSIPSTSDSLLTLTLTQVRASAVAAAASVATSVASAARGTTSVAPTAVATSTVAV